jgi:hypothetical protein
MCSYRLLRHILVSILLLMVLPQVVAQESLQTPGSEVQLFDRPIVYAVAIGVGRNRARVDAAEESAMAFARAVEHSYGAKPEILLADASRDRLTAVQATILQLPAGSLIFFYYCGHASTLVRRDNVPPGGLQRSRLMLSLSEPQDEIGRAAAYVFFHDILSSIQSVPYSNAVIVLDCCSADAARDALASVETELQAQGSRAILLSACGSDQMATGRVFTRALIEALGPANVATVSCNPREFIKSLRSMVDRQRELVVDQMRRESGDPTCDPLLPEQWPQLSLLGDNNGQCILRLDAPCALVAVTFPLGCRTSVRVIWGDDDEEDVTDVHPAGVSLIWKQIDLHSEKRLRVESSLGKLLLDEKIKPLSEPSRLIERAITHKDIVTSGAPDRMRGAAAYADAMKQLAVLGASIGEAPDEIELRGLLAAGPDLDRQRVQDALSRLVAYKPENITYRIALAPREAIAELDSGISVDTMENAAQFASRIGHLESTAVAAEWLSRHSSNGDQRGVYLCQAMANYQLAGLRADVVRLGDQISDPSLEIPVLWKDAALASIDADHAGLSEVSAALAGNIASAWDLVGTDRSLLDFSLGTAGFRETLHVWRGTLDGFVKNPERQLLATQLKEWAPGRKWIHSRGDSLALFVSGNRLFSPGAVRARLANVTDTLEFDMECLGVKGVTLVSTDRNDALQCVVSKPGWYTRFEDDSLIVLRESQDASTAPGFAVSLSSNPLGLQRIVATDLDELRNYVFQRDGFDVRFDGSSLCIRGLSDDNPNGYCGLIATPIGQISACSQDRAVMDNYLEPGWSLPIGSIRPTDLRE